MIPTDKERSVILGEYMLCHKATVRATAKEFGISKSTVHKDLTDRLPKVSPQLYRQVKVERIQHHQTSFTTNAKGTSLDRKQNMN